VALADVGGGALAVDAAGVADGPAHHSTRARERKQ
jgi:hypothetical protein